MLLTQRLVLAVICVALVACAASTDVSRDTLLTDSSIGPFRLGMTTKDIESLGVPFAREEIRLEGDLYHRYKVSTGEGAEVGVNVDASGKAYELSTSSMGFVTKNGAHVGMTLSELQSSFPQGKVNRGYADGLYFVFVTRDGGGVFSFDVNVIGEDCVLPERKCGRDISGQRSVKYFVR